MYSYIENQRKMTEQTILKAITDLKTELKKDIEGINNNLNNKFATLQEDLNAVKIKQKELEKRIIRNEMDARKRNILIYNLEEIENNQIELEATIIDLINRVLEVDMKTDEIDFIYRLGEKSEKTRPLRLGITSYRKKNMIMSNKYKLREIPRKIFLTDDLPKEISNQKKQLRTALLELKDKGINANIVRGKIVTDNATLSEEQICKINNQVEKRKRQRSEDDEASPNTKEHIQNNNSKKGKVMQNETHPKQKSVSIDAYLSSLEEDNIKQQ